MARPLSVDTSFVIDLQRERRQGEGGPAHRFLEAEAGSELCLSVVALGEMTQGFPDSEHPSIRVLRDTHLLLPVDEDVALLYGALARELRERGTPIGSNDLWIAATSLRHELPLVTADASAFSRIPRLQVLRYR